MAYGHWLSFKKILKKGSSLNMKEITMNRFALSLSKSVLLGKEAEIEHELTMAEAFKDNPELRGFRPQRLSINAAGPGLFLLKEVIVRDVNIILGNMMDAWQFNPNSVGMSLDAPSLRRIDKVSFKGTYTGRVPWWPHRPESAEGTDALVPFKPGEPFLLSLGLSGPAFMKDDKLDERAEMFGFKAEDFLQGPEGPTGSGGENGPSGPSSPVG